MQTKQSILQLIVNHTIYNEHTIREILMASAIILVLAGTIRYAKAVYSEQVQPSGTLAALLTILTLQQFTIETTAFPVYLAISNALIFGLIAMRRRKVSQSEDALQAA